MIRAIIFDVGGVLLHPVSRKFLERITKKYGIPVNRTIDALNAFLPEFEEGHITYAEMRKGIGEELGIKPSDFDWLEPVRNAIIDNDMLAMARRAGRSYTIAYLSNVDKERHKIVKKTLDTVPFKYRFASCYVGLRKPNPAIYRFALRKMDAKASETVFIDDVPENVRAAKRLGIHAIWFTGEDALKKELKLLGVKL